MKSCFKTSVATFFWKKGITRKIDATVVSLGILKEFSRLVLWLSTVINEF